MIEAGPDPRVRAVAESYMRERGLPYSPPTRYAKVDPARAARIARAFDEMQHEPHHPLVRASYEALGRETRAQYEHAKKHGFKAEFMPPGVDHYAASPRMAVEDIAKNHHLYVFPTMAGYGSGVIPAHELRENPMLADTGERWGGQPVLLNDLFRAVHDYYGHAKEGVGFRADGEENAWRSHAAMYTPLARIAATTETRGQNSWLNYGPHGEANRTAPTEDTVFADQKLGALPLWALHEGAEDFLRPEDVEELRHIYQLHGRHRRTRAEGGAVGDERPGFTAYHGSPHDFDRFDIAHLGSGEGAQVYGHGLYFAEHPAVAQAYRDKLAGPSSSGSMLFDGREVVKPGGGPGEAWYDHSLTDPELGVHPKDIHHAFRTGYGRPEHIRRQLQEDADYARSRIDDEDEYGDHKVSESGKEAMRKIWRDSAASSDNAVKWYEKHGHRLTGEFPGRSYRVRIKADPEHFLDWDKPFTDQHPVVQGAFTKLNPHLFDEGHPEFHPEDRDKVLKLSGKSLLRYLEHDFRTPEAAAKALLARGVPGVRFFDQGSRVGTTGTRNYVTFHHDPIEVEEKYADGGDVVAHPLHHEYGAGSGMHRLDAERQARADGGQVDAGAPGVTAYHGSPHGFDQFDISKLGTGEGHQAYGHGLYFAGSPAVAHGYRRQLAGTASATTFDGRPLMTKGTPGEAWNDEGLFDLNAGFHPRSLYPAFEENFGHHGRTLETLRQRASQWRDRGEDHMARRLDRQADWFAQHGHRMQGDFPGHSYKVRIKAAPEQFLDWDKPLAEQSHMHAPLAKALQPHDLSLQDFAEILRGDGDLGKVTGERAYHKLAELHDDSPAAASEALRAAGVHGIRYLDGHSRHKETAAGSHNYVTFHHEPVEVEEKYGRGGDVRSERADGGQVAKTVKVAQPIEHPAAPPPAEPEPAYKPKRFQTVKNATGMPYPGIYANPREMAAEAESRVAPESPALKQLFGITRAEMHERGAHRKGNMEPKLPFKGGDRRSDAVEGVMQPRNAQRLRDIVGEALKQPGLSQGMMPWYYMDPVLHRLKELMPEEEALRRYKHFNTLLGMASPGSEVTTELNRGIAAHSLHEQGRFEDFERWGGAGAEQRGADFPEHMRPVMGHPYHSTSQALPMRKYIDRGELEMGSAKVPTYIAASGTPETGFQTTMPVADAHFTRLLGLGDTRGGTRQNRGKAMLVPEYKHLGPWFKKHVSDKAGIEAVPAQALVWGAGSKATGVDSPIGSPKLELLADHIMQVAKRHGISPEKARDLVLTGKIYARGGAVDAGGAVDHALRVVRSQ